MKTTLTSVFLLFCFSANACECFNNLKQSIESYDLIVKAKVVGLKDTIQYDIFSNLVYPPYETGSSPKLKVSKVYKGNLASKKIELVSHHTLCDYYFKPGKEYVIFISRINGKLETSVCAHNFETTDRITLKEFKKLYKNK